MLFLLVGLNLILRISFLCPRILEKACFNFFMLLSFLGTAVSCYTIHALRFVGLKLDTAETWSRFVASVMFKISKWMSPQVHVRWVDGSLSWGELRGPHVLMVNHTSFFDSILVMWMSPPTYFARTKTLFKASLRKMPLLGTMAWGCGMFPVYFKSDESAAFDVDREKQAAVAASIRSFLSVGNRGLSLFPEGMINRHPEQLNTFRIGSFSYAIEHKLPIYYVVTWGCDKVWPVGKLGGGRTNVYAVLRRWHVDEPEKLTALEMSKRLQVDMQRDLDMLMSFSSSAAHERSS